MNEIFGQRCAAASPMADAAEVHARKTRVKADRLIDGRDAEEDRHRSCFDEIEHMARAARNEHGERVQIDAGRVEERQEIHRAVLGAEARRLLHVDGVRERHARRLDHGLGLAGSAGCVEQIPDAVRRPSGLAILARGGTLGKFLAVIEGQAFDVAFACDDVGERRRRLIVQEKSRAAIRQDRAELARCLAPVERHENERCFCAGKKQREEEWRVVTEDSNALAFFASARFEHCGETLGEIIDLRESPRPIARNIPEGNRARRQQRALAREVGNGAHECLQDRTAPSCGARVTPAGAVRGLWR